MSSDIGIYGLSTRGINLAVNLAKKGIKECTQLAEKKDVEDKVNGIKDPAEFCENLSSPKKVILLAKPGVSIEKNHIKILSCLSEGDILVDGSDEGYETCLRRSKEAEEKGVHYLTMGILGTDKEVLTGCGFVLSGDRIGYDEIEIVLKKAASEMDYEASMAYIGSSVMASYSIMVFNGVICAYEQMICETYDILHSAGFTNEEISKSMTTWNHDELEGPIIENSCIILRKKDEHVEGVEKGEGSLLDKVSDIPREMTECASLLRELNDRRVDCISLLSAVSETYMSECNDRAKVSSLLRGPEFDWQKLDHVQLVEDLRNSLVFGVVCLCSQAFALVGAASTDFEWNGKLSELSRVLCASSIIRCGVMNSVKDAFEKKNGLSTLLLDETICEVLQSKQISIRRIANLSIVSGITVPVVVSCLAYFDSIRREKIPYNLVMGQNDYYTNDTFERLDMPRGLSYHCRWTSEHK